MTARTAVVLLAMTFAGCEGNTPDRAALALDPATSGATASPEAAGSSHSAWRPTQTTGPAHSAAAAWEPGDPIPGWDDFPCPELTDNYVSVSVPFQHQTWGTVGGCQGGQCSVEQPSRFIGHFYDDLDADYNRSATQFIVWVDGSLTAGNPERSQGWYHSAIRAGVFDRTGGTFLGIPGPDGDFVDAAWADTSGYEFDTESWICLSRVRPDQLTGVAWIRPYRGDRGLYWDGPKVTFRVPFDVIFPDNSAVYVEDPYSFGDYPWSSVTAAWSYYHDENYGTAWPWHEIEDPALRDAYMERYRPYVDVYGPP